MKATALTKTASWWRRRSRTQKILLILGVGILLYLVLHRKATLADATIETAKIQALSRTVSASGTVTSSTDLNLSFSESETVTTVAVAVGNVVRKGQLLAEERHDAESASVLRARGSLLAAEASYDKVKAGTRSEEIRIAEVALDTTTKTQNNLVDNARKTLYSDDLVAEPQGDTPDTNTPIITGAYTGEPGEYRVHFEDFGRNEFNTTGLERGGGDVDELAKPFGTKGLSISFPADKSQYQSDNYWKVTIPNENGANYTQNLNAYNAAVATRDAEIAQAQANLDLKNASAEQPDVDLAYANVVSAQGGLNAALAELEKKIIRAPSDGTITKVDVKAGDQPAALSGVITLQDVRNLYIEAPVNESDISQLSLGQAIAVTYDAFGTDKSFTAHISSIDLAPTVSDGIVNYEIKAQIDDATNVRPGMTANLSITTATVPSALVVPARTIATGADGTKSVQVLIDEKKGKTATRRVETGLTGDGDVVQITSGLTEGDNVVFYPNK